MIKYLGDIIENPVPKKTRLRLNKEREWKAKYYSEHDLVVISKDGTLGDVYQINGIKIGFPARPLKRDIKNYKLPQEKQKWERDKIPDGLNRDTMHSFDAYTDEEFLRREQGFWVYIKGMPIYMTGVYYFFLQWTRLDDGYPRFRQIQNELMIYWEACKVDQRSFGICYVKNRRFGWSSLSISELLESGIITAEKELGIISKTGEDGRKMFGKLVRAFKKLPCFFMPEWDGTSTPKKELILSKPTRKRSKNYVADDDDGLDTTIRYFNTAINAMDGDKMFRSAIDEAGKFPKEVPFDRYWSIVKTSHTQGARIVGKAMVGSTVNDLSKGGAEFKKVYYASTPTDERFNNQTQSGLYSLFISAQYCLEGFFDPYGFSVYNDPEEPVENDLGELISIGANTYLDNQLESLKNDPEAFNEQLRQFPRTERDAFRDAATDSYFNVLKLIEQIDYNDALTEKPYERGNFIWEGGIPDTKVKWVPDPANGRFKITHHPSVSNRNIYVERKLNGVLAKAPMAGYIGTLGVDPYNRSKAADSRGSKGAIHLCTSENTSDLPNNAFILEYIARPRKIEMFFEDVIMCMVYYSVPFLAELSNESFLRLVRDRGYRHYSMNNPFKNLRDLNPTERELGGLPQQNKTGASQQFYAVEAYIEDYVGVATDNSNRPIGTMGNIPFNETLTQWKDVDLEKRTKFDAYISSSLALLGNQRVEVKQEKRKSFSIPFAKYNNSGLTSQKKSYAYR